MNKENNMNNNEEEILEQLADELNNDEECTCPECQGLTEFPEADMDATFGMLQMPLETIQSVDYNGEDFSKGVSDNSYLAGCITALTNAGVPASEALSYFMNLKLAEVNTKMNKDKCKAQVDMAKHIKKNMEEDSPI
jgi:hypothetical protein